MMKTFYAVRTKFYDNGRMAVSRWTEEAKEKPENFQEANEYCDVYVDWFENESEADALFKDALAEGAKVVRCLNAIPTFIRPR